jgi:hypothetical protein
MASVPGAVTVKGSDLDRFWIDLERCTRTSCRLDYVRLNVRLEVRRGKPAFSSRLGLSTRLRPNFQGYHAGLPIGEGLLVVRARSAVFVTNAPLIHNHLSEQFQRKIAAPLGMNVADALSCLGRAALARRVRSPKIFVDRIFIIDASQKK